MTEDTPISPEAEARKTIDSLKVQIAEATRIAQEALVRDRLVQQFAGQGKTNPFDLATRALDKFKDVTKETPDTDLGARAAQWYEAERAMFTPGEPVSPVAAPVATPNPFGGVQPNLTAPGLQPKATPVVIGSKEYTEQGWANKPMSEQIAAMRGESPALVSSDKVRLQQQEPGFLR